MDSFPGTLISIHVALPVIYRDARWQDAPWASAFHKYAVDGPVWLGRTNLDGDGQGDTDNHGGVDKAALCYSADHYPLWRSEHPLPLGPGAFGENFTITGLSEDTVCLGDTYRMGGAMVEVCQPRIPCWKISHRWNEPQLTKWVEQSGRTGWYVRVLRPGQVRAGEVVELIARPHPEWTLSRATRVLRARKRHPQEADELCSLPTLAASWQTILSG